MALQHNSSLLPAWRWRGRFSKSGPDPLPPTAPLQEISAGALFHPLYSVQSFTPARISAVSSMFFVPGTLCALAADKSSQQMKTKPSLPFLLSLPWLHKWAGLLSWHQPAVPQLQIPCMSHAREIQDSHPGSLAFCNTSHHIHLLDRAPGAQPLP